MALDETLLTVRELAQGRGGRASVPDPLLGWRPSGGGESCSLDPSTYVMVCGVHSYAVRAGPDDAVAATTARPGVQGCAAKASGCSCSHESSMPYVSHAGKGSAPGRTSPSDIRHADKALWRGSARRFVLMKTSS